MPPRIPKAIRAHGLTFPVWQLGDRRFATSYTQHGDHHVVKRRVLEDLIAFVQDKAREIIEGKTRAEQISPAELRAYAHARELLEPHHITVEAGARILLEAAQHAGGIDRILESCRLYGKSGPAGRNVPVPEVLAQFLRHLSADGVSAIYLSKMEDDLGKFAAQFPGPFAMLRAAEMEDWLRAMPVGLRRRRNLRDKLVALFNFARDHDYLPSALRTEAEKIKRPKIARKAPAIYTPEEFDLILTQCAQPPDKRTGRLDYMAFVPSLVIAAFAGLRWAEIQRLEWSHVHFADAVIEVGEENKTGYRLVPIEPNLATLLRPWRDTRGPVCTFKRPDHVLTSLRTRAGLPASPRRYANALRHSYVTYLVAVKKNMPLVAGHSGHSVAELRRSYHRASLERAGKAWFAIGQETGNVLQMPLGSLRLG